MSPVLHPHAHRWPRRAEAGAASLIVVMVLFFLLSLVAAYTSRNLIFEQRTSVNQYRSMQALEAADAGIEWALSMLNAGRIDDDCNEVTTAANTSFRQRYLSIDPVTGMVTPRRGATANQELWITCVDTGGGWTCKCPTDANTNPTAPTGGGVYPAFRVRFKTQYIATNVAVVSSIARPGVVIIESNGCTRYDETCLKHPFGGAAATALEMDGRANVAQVVGLKGSISVPPGAALTVLGDMAGGSALQVYNTDASVGGVTIRARGANVNIAAPVGVYSVAGTPGSASVVRSDASLTALSANSDSAFAALFGANPNAYRRQQGTVEVDCSAADCRSTLAARIAANPDRVIWVTGDLNLTTAGDIGSLPDAANSAVPGPAVIVVAGNVNATGAGATARIFGLVYSTGGSWVGGPEIQGAAYVGTNLAATAAPTVVMNRTVLEWLRVRSGTFVRLPGGWDDFRPRHMTPTTP